MKKVLLFGTAILVATSVFAFGGGGGKSRKASVYRGTGIDSIGVHFNGKDDDSGKETCSDGIKCGSGCCYGDNVCKQNESGEYQCCSEELNHCCPISGGAYRIFRGYWETTCCAGKLFCSYKDAEDNCTSTSCCPTGGKVYGPYERDDGTKEYLCCDGEPYINGKFSYGDQYMCCSNGGKVYKEKGVDGADLCCYDGKKPVCAEYDDAGNCTVHICCAEGEKGYCAEYETNGEKCRGYGYACGKADCVTSFFIQQNYYYQAACCSEGETPYCVSRYEGCCGGASWRCCPGTVTPGSKNEPDTCVL